MQARDMISYFLFSADENSQKSIEPSVGTIDSHRLAFLRLFCLIVFISPRFGVSNVTIHGFEQCSDRVGFITFYNTMFSFRKFSPRGNRPPGITNCLFQQSDIVRIGTSCSQPQLDPIGISQHGAFGSLLFTIRSIFPWRLAICGVLVIESSTHDQWRPNPTESS